MNSHTMSDDAWPLGLVSNCWRVQLENGIPLGTLMAEAVRRKLTVIELRQKSLGKFESGPNNVPDAGRLTKEQSGSHKLTIDGHHANSAGEYLGACVLYEVLFGDSAVGNEFIPLGLAKDDAGFLQETAHKAVIASRTRRLSVEWK